MNNNVTDIFNLDPVLQQLWQQANGVEFPKDTLDIINQVLNTRLTEKIEKRAKDNATKDSIPPIITKRMIDLE